MNKTTTQTLTGLLYCALLLGLTACSGAGMSSAQEKSLNQFLDDLDQLYADGDAALASGKHEIGLLFNLSLEKKQLDLVTTHLASNSYPPQVQQHFDNMKGGLDTAVKLHARWLAVGLDRDSAPADEAQASDTAAMQFTNAETQLKITAGR